MPTTVWNHLSRPFVNLTVKDRALQLVRLFSSLLTLSLCLALLVGPLVTNDMYIGRINCAHLDVSYGLYKSLRTSVSSSSNILDSSDEEVRYPVDHTLTNSEISILTEYASAQVADAPQYILTSLWSWCYGNYNITKYKDSHGIMKTKVSDQVLSCSKINKSYVFDYRAELELVGLKSILAYALQSHESDPKYEREVSARDKKYKLVTPAIITGGLLQLVIVVMTLVIYGNRGSAKDLSKIPSLVFNVMALLTVASMLALTIGAAIISNVLIEIKSEISKSLGSFGVSLSMGRIWFSLLWIAQGFSALAMLTWAAPAWCANPEDEEDDDYEQFHYSNRRSYVPRRKTTENFTDVDPFHDDTDITSDQPVEPLEKSTRMDKMRRSLHNQKKRLSGLRLSVSGRPDSQHSDGELTNLIDDEEHPHHRFSFAKGMFSIHNSHDAKNEEELRMLGKSLSKKSSVRRMNTKLSRVQVEPVILEEEQTRKLLYADRDKFDVYRNQNILNHYREETYDGYGTSSASNPPMVSPLPEAEPYNGHRNLIPRPQPKPLGTSSERHSFDDQHSYTSILDPEEIDLLNSEPMDQFRNYYPH